MKPGYYLDIEGDMWIFYPCGKMELCHCTYWVKWLLPDTQEEIHDEFRLEFLGPL